MIISFPYLAGYIDGDGHFSCRRRINKRGYYRREASISIVSTKEDVLTSFHHSFGGRLSKSTPKNVNWSIQYKWTVQGKIALDIAQNVLPFLKEKHAECNIFINFLACQFSIDGIRILEEFTNCRKNSIVTTVDHIDYIRSIKQRKLCTNDDFSYLAGYIDAECSIGVSKFMKKDRNFPSYKIRVSVGSVCPIVPIWIMERFHGSASFINKSATNPTNRNQIHLNINSTDSFTIVKNIIPYIQTKKAVCEKILEFKETMLPRGYGRLKSFRKDIQSIESIRESLINHIHILNSKGSSVKRVVISATSAVSFI